MKLLASKKIIPITSAPINNGAIAVDGKTIADLGTRKTLIRKYPEAELSDLGDVTLMPGLINTHTHLELSNLEGLYHAERDFFRWIIRLIDKRRELGLTGLKPAASRALMQAVSTGTTCIGDISGTGLVAGKLKSSGVRAVIFHEMIGMDPKTAEGSIRHLRERLLKFNRLPGRITQGVSPHSAYSVSGKLLDMISGDISETTLPLCMHIAESADEIRHLNGKSSDIRDYLEYTGWSKHPHNKAASPLELMKIHGLLDGALVVHAVHITKSDIKRLKSHKASVSHCPRSNQLLGVGSAPVREMLDAGVNVSLGTDSLASNLDLDMWEEMRFSYVVNDITAEEALRMATVCGAKALGLNGVTGALEPGLEADIIAVRSPATEARDPYPALVCHTKGDDVVMGMVQGRVIYNRDGMDI